MKKQELIDKIKEQNLTQENWRQPRNGTSTIQNADIRRVSETTRN
jgi:hypothetical protein